MKPVTPVPLSLEDVRLILQYLNVNKTPESIEVAKKLAWYEYLLQSLVAEGELRNEAIKGDVELDEHK